MNGIAELYRLSELEPGKPAQMMVFPVGDWTSAKYPRLSLSQELANEVIANFEADALRTRVPVDLNHDPKSPANGWVDRLYMAPFEWQGVAGEALFADWTPNERGAQLVNDGEYAYDSLEIAAHEDPVTGTTYDNVLKAISLTNRPVLRMMPPVAEAGDALRLAEPLELQLSEVTAAEDPDPVSALLADLEAVLDKASTTLKGKPGIPAIRTYLRETLSKASAHKQLAEDDSYQQLRESLEAALEGLTGVRCWVEDFGDDWLVYERSTIEDPPHWYRVPYVRDASGVTLGQPVEVKRETTYVPVTDGAPGASSSSGSQVVATGEAGEGTSSSLSEGHAARKGSDSMKTVIQLLKLSEDADEPLVLAEVQKVIGERDEAVAKLAEREQADRKAAVERTLTELIEGGHLLPGQKDEMLALSEDSPSGFDRACAVLKTSKAIQLGESGSAAEGESLTEGDDVTVEVADKATKLAEERGVPYASALVLALAEDPALAERYANREL